MIFSHPRKYQKWESAAGRSQAIRRRTEYWREKMAEEGRGGLTAEEDMRLDEILNRYTPVTEEFK